MSNPFTLSSTKAARVEKGLFLCCSGVIAPHKVHEDVTSKPVDQRTQVNYLLMRDTLFFLCCSCAGSIPTDLGTLPKLQRLLLHDNHLTGKRSVAEGCLLELSSPHRRMAISAGALEG